jgi:hypothetical protein
MINIFKNKIASVLIIIALIVVISVFVINMIRSSKQEQIDEAKMAKVDSLYSIWTDVAGAGDKQTLENNKAKYTREIYDKLSDEEIQFLTEYSENFRTLKNEPSLFTPTSIAMGGYLVQNFNKMKQVAAKTSLKDYLNKFGVTIGTRMSSIM